MALAIDYEYESEIVETDAESRLHLLAAEPHRKYVLIHEVGGAIRLVPLDQLHESEQEILENPDLHDAIKTGLQEFATGQRVSSDWLFDDDQ